MNWTDILSEEKNKSYFIKIFDFINSEISKGKIIYPNKNDIFNAFKYTNLNDLKVVILGQDPYHNYNQAHGLSFSVKKKMNIPPSLQNIYKELDRSLLNFKIPNHGCLINWAKQGVFLLNTILTVEANKANSHKNVGWENFTDNVIRKISENKNSIVFMLWGLQARKKKILIDTSKHLILESTHPSPLSAYRGFLGCNHFLNCNKYLIRKRKIQINWNLI